MEQEALLKQVEYYFSPANLTTDMYLVSQMNSEFFVPLDTILKFKMVQKHTGDIQILKRVIKSSKKLVLNSDESSVKAIDIIHEEIQKERNTLIIRDAKSTQSDIEKLMIWQSPISIKKEVGENWFISFKSESEALECFEYLKDKTLNGEILKVRVKSEPLIKQFVVKEVEKTNKPLSFAEIALSAKEIKVPVKTVVKTVPITNGTDGEKKEKKEKKIVSKENGTKEKGQTKKKSEPKRLHK
jgi:hypothetical protein